MRNGLKIILIILLSMVLISCNHSYKEIKENSPHATIRSEVNGDNFLSFSKVLILEINEFQVTPMWKGYGSKRRISVGKNTIFVESNSGHLRGTTYIDFYTKPYQNYIITYEGDSKEIVFKIYNEKTKKVIQTKNVVREKIGQNTTYVPIFIPK